MNVVGASVVREHSARESMTSSSTPENRIGNAIRRRKLGRSWQRNRIDRAALLAVLRWCL